MAYYLERRTFVGMVDAARGDEEPSTLKTSDQVYEALRICFAGTDPRENARELGRACVVAYTRLGEPLSPYYQFASSMFDALRNATGPEPSQAQWLSAIRLLAAHENVVMQFQASTDTVLRICPASAAIGEASARLERLGISLGVTEKGEIDLSATERRQLGLEIDKLASLVGGPYIVEQTFKRLDMQRRYDADFERWQLLRVSDNYQEAAPRPQTPWGYLYNLGVKHFDVQGNRNSSDFERLISLVKDSLALLDVQQYYSMEGMILGPNRILPFLLDSVVYDSLFTFSQFRGRDASQLLSFLASQLEDKDADEKATLLRRVATTAVGLLSQADPIHPKILQPGEVARSLRRSQAHVKPLLDTHFSHAAGANANLTFPPQTTDIDFDDLPLLRLKSGGYFCPPLSLCGKATLQAFLNYCEKNVNDFGRRVGVLLETYFFNAAKSRGLRPKRGNYTVDNAQFDCDLVVETQDAIVFLEVKKKGLNRLSRSASEHADMELIADLAKGVVTSQHQALRHELALRKLGRLELKSRDGEHAEVHWKGQKVYRVSVTLFECGSLHHRNTLMQLLKMSSTSTISSKHEGHQQESVKVNKLFLSLNALALSAGVLNDKFPFDNCYLLSTPQLILLLQNSTGNESFVDELTRGSRTFVGSKDFYDHYRFSKNLPNPSATKIELPTE